MGDLINGRCPAEIKNGLRNMLETCADISGIKDTICQEMCCPYDDDNCCHETILMGALALIERLEDAQPKWISVKERPPTEEDGTDEGKIICVPSKLYGSMAGNVRIYPWDIVASYSSLVTHWMPLPEPPEEKKHDDHYSDWKR